MFKRLIRYIDALLFPPHCVFCGKILDYREDSVCVDCLRNLPFILQPRCVRCGKEVENEGDFCLDCMDGNHIFENGRAVWKYEGKVSESILRFKYHNQREYGETYAKWMVRCLGEWILRMKIDVIVPVPIHKSRMLKRGYNQAELIAVEMGELMNIPVSTDGVVRIKKTVPQKKLSVLERMRNMQHSFRVEKDVFAGKNVLVIDDIYTTGITIDALSAVLMKKGAGKVYFAAVSQGV